MDESVELDERYRYPIVPHADTGAPDCCGCIFPVFRDNEADITCNECGAVVKTVAADRAVDALMEMALAQESCTATYPHCGQESIFPGFSKMFMFICDHCEEPVALGERRPLPPPPRCRGISIGDGHYTGCAYGYGDVPPFSGPCDCPTCNGSGVEGEGAFHPN